MIDAVTLNGATTIEPPPDKPPFPRYKNNWVLTSGQLARFQVQGNEIRHDCGATVSTVEDSCMLALIVGAIAEHVCDTP